MFTVEYEHEIAYGHDPNGRQYPRLTLRLMNPANAERAVDLDAYLDSGTERSLFNGSLAPLLGIDDLLAGVEIPYQSTVGPALAARLHPVRISHRSGPNTSVAAHHFPKGGRTPMALDIRKPLKKLLPHLLKAQADNLNEGDTVQRVIKVFEEVLGYDPMSEISRESSVKDRYCDLALKIDDAIRILVEVKAAGTALRDRHTEQAQNYASHSNIRWVVLTNGVAWNLYHLTFEEGIEATLAFTVMLEEGVGDKAAELLALLHRQAVKKGDLDGYWEQRVALSPASIGRALFTEEALKFIRREIRRREGILIDEEDLAAAIHEMLSTEARERIGPMKIKRRARARAAKSPGAEPIPEATAAPGPQKPPAKEGGNA